MARRATWIGMALAIPATVAFTPFQPPGPLPGPPPPAPQVVAAAQPVVATSPVAPAQPVVATSPLPAAQPVVATSPLPAAQPVVAATPAAAAPVVLPPILPPAPDGMAAPNRDVGSIVVDAALTRVGAPYAWGGTGPDSFDCSGLVVWAFHEAGITLPRSSQALASGGQPVPLDQMQPGDVISFFPDASHVGIYVGDGRVIHAPFDGVPVVVESLNTAPINNVRRYG